MRIGDIAVGDGGPLVLISGLNVIESFEGALECALGVQGVGERHGLPVVFKESGVLPVEYHGSAHVHALCFADEFHCYTLKSVGSVFVNQCLQFLFMDLLYHSSNFWVTIIL